MCGPLRVFTLIYLNVVSRLRGRVGMIECIVDWQRCHLCMLAIGFFAPFGGTGTSLARCPTWCSFLALH